MNNLLQYGSLAILLPFLTACANPAAVTTIPTDPATVEAGASTPAENAVLYFTPGESVFGRSRSFGIAITDVELDGDNDIFISNYIGASKLWLNDGSGTFIDSEQTFGAASAEVHDVGLGDLNGDSYPDVFLIAHAYPGKVFFNDGSGNFFDSQQTIGAASDAPQSVDLGDIDSDGDLDIFITYANKSNQLWVNDGAGYFSLSEHTFGEEPAPELFLMDFNADSVPDLYLCYRGRSAEILLNDGTGIFSPSDLLTRGQIGCDGIAGGDIDGDGDNDLVVAKIEQGIRVWLNEGNAGSFTQSGRTFYSGAVKIGLIDADDDGDPDLIASNIARGETSLWINDGSGAFSAAPQTLDSAWAFSIAAADLDGDLDDDLVLGNEIDTDGVLLLFQD